MNKELCTAIADANSSIRTTDIKGKDYAEVNQRVKAFRMVNPSGSIQTDIIRLENGVVTMKASVYDDTGVLIATGYAQEKEDSTFINKTSFIENCETSAVGRALGFCGYGIETSICSKEELENAINNQDKSKEKTQTKKAEPKKAESKAESKVQMITPEQMKTINNYESKLIDWFLARCKIDTLNQATFKQADEFIKAVNNKKGGNK